MKARNQKGSRPYRGYSAPGKEKAFTKEDLETDDEARRESVRKIVDCKARKMMIGWERTRLMLESFYIGGLRSLQR